MTLPLLRSRALSTAAAIGIVGCFANGVRLSPEVAGCYRVIADEWSRNHQRITGLRALPSTIALDTARSGVVLVPASWRAADPPNWNWAQMQLHSLPWFWSGDTLRFDYYDRPHALAKDSVIVSFMGWSGGMTAFLARKDDGFSGFGFFGPRIDADRAYGIAVRLRPGACPTDLGEALYPGVSR